MPAAFDSQFEAGFAISRDIPYTRYGGVCKFADNRFHTRVMAQVVSISANKGASLIRSVSTIGEQVRIPTLDPDPTPSPRCREVIDQLGVKIGVPDRRDFLAPVFNGVRSPHMANLDQSWSTSTLTSRWSATWRCRRTERRDAVGNAEVAFRRRKGPRRRHRVAIQVPASAGDHRPRHAPDHSATSRSTAPTREKNASRVKRPPGPDWEQWACSASPALQPIMSALLSTRLLSCRRRRSLVTTVVHAAPGI